MNLLEAAKKVLRETGRPMHSKEIIEFARKSGWIRPRGQTPDHSLQAAIWKDIRKRGKKSEFKLTGYATVERKYSLRASTDQG